MAIAVCLEFDRGRAIGLGPGGNHKNSATMVVPLWLVAFCHQQKNMTFAGW